ncbi:MAG: CoA activase [Planctomycetes bacterium]|nr:CoA activase [Planctomycetota bacterium]
MQKAEEASLKYPNGVTIGMDVGSTTVKAVVMDPVTDEILWSDYQRHETKQPEKVFELLEKIFQSFPLPYTRVRCFITGSGGTALASLINAKFVQEVNAVSLAVEKYYPDAGSVIELGGQDAKIIIWQLDERTGQRRKVPSMNDKCAGGTGAVIDKINAKLKVPVETLRQLPYFGVKLHPVAGKCGVFAETDINGLQKQGVPAGELMASLFEAIVQQNLSVLTRGNTLRHQVLLLGGPNTFIPAMRDAWKNNIPKIWAERKYPLPEGVDPKDLIIVPNNAQYFAAIGAVLYGKSEDAHVAVFSGMETIAAYIGGGRDKMREASGGKALWDTQEELAQFVKDYTIPRHVFPEFAAGQVVEGWMGIDGGSTSTKAVLVNNKGDLIGAYYQLSKGNPLLDTKEVVAGLKEVIEKNGATLVIKGVGTTGYAKDILKDTIGGDVALVETVAHTQSALHFYKDVDVIVDVGGQDIKVIMLNDGRVADFKLNTQCSAGNGYFLQSTAGKFGHPVEKFAETAFSAKKLPIFSYGCAVFMESDIVNFQQLGWSPQEIMAGLAHVLPKNIWLYVVQEPNLNKLGKKFVLQGGTQRNLAAVKSQVDFIKGKVPGAEVIVHKFCGESGAIGCAIEAHRVTGKSGKTNFIGFEALLGLSYSSKRDESTRCYFCKNKCLRTFIDTQTPAGDNRRFIIATCEKGTVEDVAAMRKIKSKMDGLKKDNPNFVDLAARRAFESYEPEVAVKDEPGKLLGFISTPRLREQLEKRARRKTIKIGMPKVLNMYSTGPYWSAYLESIGVDRKNIIWSETTNEEMYKEGSRRGSIDQCFPAKVALAHIHNLLYKKKPDVIFFPIPNTMISELTHVVDSYACPTVSATPEVVKAAFTKERDLFKEAGMEYWDPCIDMKNFALAERQMFEWFGPRLGVTRAENKFALEQAEKALKAFREELRVGGRKALDKLKAEGKLGVVLLARPYHNDPGLNHEILEELQLMGYPIFALDSLPIEQDILDEVFGEDVKKGLIPGPMAISDVWKNSYSHNSSQKLWGAKYTARHPNLVGLDLSSFKCGHDAPIYGAVDEIVSASKTPYFTFHDIDENKPTGSIKIRTETINYFLTRYAEAKREEADKKKKLAELIAAKKAELLAKRAEQPKSDPELTAVG